MAKATIYDYARICKAFENNCGICPMCIGNNGTNELCAKLVMKFPDKANEIILKWCKEHPVETRLDRFLKMFPKANICRGCLEISPCNVDIRQFDSEKCGTKSCAKCRKEYWLAEVDENE
mgnify:CR=1 FL=1